MAERRVGLYPELFQIGAWTLRSYTVVTEIGIVVGIVVAYMVARRHGIRAETFLDLTIWTIIAGVVGSRLYYVAITWEQEQFYADPVRILYSWEGGLVFQGAILGAVPMLAFLVRRHRLPYLMLADIGVIGLSIGHAVGRWACLFEGCCYGQPTDLPWGVLFPTHAEPLHPTMIYESLANLVIFATLWQVDKRKPFLGFTSALYLISYSSARFLIEFLRGDPAEMVLGLRLAQWVCLVTILAGIALLLYLRRTQPADRFAGVQPEGLEGQ